jgi:gamma-glutamyltranspeptidase
MKALCGWAILLLCLASMGGAADRPPALSRGDQLLADYFRDETADLSRRCLANIKTADDWNAAKPELRRQLAEMLGLWPEPPRTDLKPVITGKIEADEFTVEKLQFQSSPHLYVTGDLYLPKHQTKPAPTILYVCGHSQTKVNGIAYGAKPSYQHHGEWFARNGYVCLIIDPLELGEIEGEHHGTYRREMWWWHSRGYTPAGVEAWNSMRAIDYLISRPEVDANRIGMTGRSGGGAYTWWTAALDDRVKVACPVAGITDLQNYVVDGCIEGHCDCMFMDNTYRWDFAQVAALVAPRPMLIGNSDKDTIFPLDGVYRVHEQTRRIYRLLGAEKNLGLLITEGPHKDTQDLQVPVFRWFNRFLKGEEGTVDKVATPFFDAPKLKVFDELPRDQINTTIHESFVPAAPKPAIPNSVQEWAAMRANWMAALREKTFMGWPQSPPALDVKRAFSRSREGATLTGYDFVSQRNVPLRLYVITADQIKPNRLQLEVLDEETWGVWQVRMRRRFGDDLDDLKGSVEVARGVQQPYHTDTAMAWIAPRGIGLSGWTSDPKKQVQIKRRFALLGQTLDGMRVWDVRRAIQAIRSIDSIARVPLSLSGHHRAAGVALYASLFEPDVNDLILYDLPKSHHDGPDLLNVLKTLDLPAAVAMAGERLTIQIVQADAGWEYPKAVAAKLGWGTGRVQVVGLPRELSAVPPPSSGTPGEGRGGGSSAAAEQSAPTQTLPRSTGGGNSVRSPGSTQPTPYSAEAHRAMVATVNPIATQAGLDAIRRGGNAIDAAVAAALTLGVVDGQNSGIGGGCFMLIRRADGSFVALDGRERAPAAASRDMFLRDGKVMPDASTTGALASGIPGSLAVYDFALRNAGGRSKLADLLRPAADVAEQGFPISASYASRLKSTANDLAKFPQSAAIFLDADGHAWPKDHLLKQSDLARSYRNIADSGIDWFYRGPFATAAEKWMRANGGLITAKDFADYHIVERTPLRTEYRGYAIVGFPPPSSGGVHVAQILNILDNFNVRALNDADPAQRLHVQAEAMKLAFADRAYWLGDPDQVKVPRGLVGKEYAKSLAQKIDLHRVIAVPEHSTPSQSEVDVFLQSLPPSGKHTTHIAAADAEGNWVAITTTVNTSFGSKVVVPGTGVLLNDQMDDFSIQPGVPNAFGLIGAERNSVGPGKRPLSSMSPTIVLKDNKPILTLGAAGGPTIINQVVDALVNHLDLGMPLPQAVAAPRIHHQWQPDVLVVEPDLPANVIEELKRLGHKIETRRGLGATQAIGLDDHGVFVGVHDPRVEGQAAGVD